MSINNLAQRKSLLRRYEIFEREQDQEVTNTDRGPVRGGSNASGF